MFLRVTSSLCSLWLQKIEAPVRGGEGAEGNIPDGGPPVSERGSPLGRELDREIVASQGNKERDILGSGKHRCHPPFEGTLAINRCMPGFSVVLGSVIETNNMFRSP